MRQADCSMRDAAPDFVRYRTRQSTRGRGLPRGSLRTYQCRQDQVRDPHQNPHCSVQRADSACYPQS